ncbi:MAG: ribosome biogenesis GTPase Der [Pseudomonadota bacterium]|nr:ribosome biogenesis GTPase Der [Pseudomonadota bacterium]
MIPVLALLGRPNVGKSSLFNRLTGSRAALVADVPGVTRDRRLGFARQDERDFVVIDTGGIADDSDHLHAAISAQALQAARDADLIILLTDQRQGPVTGDRDIAAELRRLDRPIVVAVNKSEGLALEEATIDFHELGLGSPLAISALHGHGIQRLLTACFEALPEDLGHPQPARPEGVAVAVIGRPNAGKSTLINRLIGEERLITQDEPGTTRDSIAVPFTYHGQPYTLVDTAGVRRRSRIDDRVEKFSVSQTLRTVEQAQVVMLVIDALRGIADQDLTLLELTLNLGRAVVIVINKWDALTPEQRSAFTTELDRRLKFADFARRCHVSALRGSGLADLMKAVARAHHHAQRQFSTRELTDLASAFQVRTPPPMVRGRRIRIRLVHQGGRNPPTFILHGNQTEALPDAYLRYLTNAYRSALHIEGSPIRLITKQGENPFRHRRNALSDRQIRRKKRERRYFQKGKH